jgi:hypothetical protein
LKKIWITSARVFKDLFELAEASTLGTMPKEATFSTVQLCVENDEMPDMQSAVSVFKDVPAKLIEIPVKVIAEQYMKTEEICESFASFDQYHDWYMRSADMPVYGSQNRWPCIASLMDDDVVHDGHHRLHAYVHAGHQTIPVLDYDYAAWWKAHATWRDANFGA